MTSELKQTIEKFRLSKIEPLMEEDDHNEIFRPEIFHQLGQLGLTGITQPEEFGGANLGYQTLNMALSELAKSSVPYAVTLSVSNMVQNIINSYGSMEQKKKFLPKLCAGEEIGAFCLTESNSGSDALSMKTTAHKTKEGYLLNGRKLWITSGGVAKTYIVMAKTEEKVSAFILRDSAQGFTYGKKEKKMGWRTSPTRELIFENCFIPHHQLIGEEGMGTKIALSALDRGRIAIAAIAVGLSQRALDEAMKYSLNRNQFNRPIFEFQGLQFMLAEMATELKASALLVEEAAKLFDKNINDAQISSMAKLKATDTAMNITSHAVQIFGGNGYSREYPLERFMRDAKALQIVEGTNQIQKIIIARFLKKQYE